MKILIVDDRAETKCKEIMEQCEKRYIDVEIEKAINPALNFLFHEKNYVDGIILDMGLSLYKDEKQFNPNGGDRILRELKRRKYNIPVLIFSEIESNEKEECDFVFDQLYNWGIKEEESKFYAFLEKLEEQS